MSLEHRQPMPQFSISLRTGVPIYEQVTYAVTRAIVSGELQPGDPFPSVRALSQDLKINPNTSHKIVAALIERGSLVVRPGIGTAVSPYPAVDCVRPAKPCSMMKPSGSSLKPGAQACRFRRSSRRFARTGREASRRAG